MLDTIDPREVAATEEKRKNIAKMLESLGIDALTRLEGLAKKELEASGVELPGELGEILGLVKTIDSTMAGGYENKFKKSLAEGKKIERIDYINLLEAVLPTLDPQGKSQFVNAELFSKLGGFLKSQFGLELVYPTPGTKVSLKDHQISGVGEGPFGSHSVVRVDGFGLKNASQPLEPAQRRANVMVTR